MRSIRFAVIIVAMLCGQAARAEPYYFSKPGVTRADYVADVSQCSELAGEASYRSGPTNTRYRDNMAGAIGTGFGLILVSIMAVGEQKRMKRAVERTCMADKGYVRRQIDRGFLNDIRGIKDKDARISRFFEYASAEHPSGKAMSE